jgi:hypothetical protein
VNELVALHTQALREPVASRYLDLLSLALRAGRLNNGFPDRRRLQTSLEALRGEFHGGLYDRIYVDARTGLPNMASFTRVITDREVAIDALVRMQDRATLDAQRAQGEVYERLARKRAYYERLLTIQPAPLDEHKVQLRRHDPRTGTAMFRLDLTKLDATGVSIRVTVDLTQVASVWRRDVIDLDQGGETARASEGFHATIYRHAAFDAEALFIQLHELEGVSVDRVQRGIVGPALFSLPDGDDPVRPVEAVDDELGRQWARRAGDLAATGPQMAVSFRSDVAARDVREERSNDPLERLAAAGVSPAERARYDEVRRRYPFRVFKDRKFVGTTAVLPLLQAVCDAAGTRNLIYPLR